MYWCSDQEKRNAAQQALQASSAVDEHSKQGKQRAISPRPGDSKNKGIDGSPNKSVWVTLLLRPMQFHHPRLPSAVPPILLAAFFGFENVVTALVEGGVDVNIQDPHNRTPLMLACAQG